MCCIHFFGDSYPVVLNQWSVRFLSVTTFLNQFLLNLEEVSGENDDLFKAFIKISFLTQVKKRFRTTARRKKTFPKNNHFSIAARIFFLENLPKI
jgi:hypothetical protein